MSVEQQELPEVVDWREKLEVFYDQLRAWMAEMVPPPTVETHPVTLHEKKSGIYEVNQLLVKRDKGEFWIRPIALWVVGADGRVDMEGGDGPFLLVRMIERKPIVNKATCELDEEVTEAWFWVQDSPPWKQVPLTGELFRGLAEVCLE